MPISACFGTEWEKEGRDLTDVLCIKHLGLKLILNLPTIINDYFIPGDIMGKLKVSNKSTDKPRL